MAVTIDPKKLREVALTAAEYQLIVQRLGRDPNDLELGMTGVLWSEHCSYKTSKPLLRRLPTTGVGVIQGPGENAGAVDIGDGWAAVFKIESHNHPSAIEPYEGAATGVGGILRDIIAMGARPVALLDSLRFGPLPDSRRHFEGVVAGIGGYGNCIGIPTVGGEVYFDECYIGNPLVNAMCVGLVRIDQLQRAKAEGSGNKLMLVGSQTGRDGIHGASFASVELDDSSEERRPAVQVGNPFLEKCVMEACLALVTHPAVVGLQDLGAAGLTSSLAEAAARGNAGVRVDVAKVPRREKGMTPYEVMLSESQERMLVVVKAGREAEIERIFARWDLEAEVIGEVTDDGIFEVTDGAEIMARIPIEVLTEGVPERHPVSRKPAPRPQLDLAKLPLPADPGSVLLRLLGSPNLGSRRPIFRRYDHMVGSSTVIEPGADAALVRILGSYRALALTTDCNARYCHLDPFVGAQIAVAEAARNIVATGARPLAVTDCLNFGNPDVPEVFWELEEAVAGIAMACRALEVPVVSGNVSLYNESDTAQGPVSIHPTPVIGMVGLIDDYRKAVSIGFKEAGDFVLLVGTTRNDLGGSEYLKIEHGQVAGPPPALDLVGEKAVQKFILDAIGLGYVRSAHDVSEGGLLVALAECCMHCGLGVTCPQMRGEHDVRLDSVWFGESQGRFVVSAPSRAMPELQTLARRHHVEVQLLGMAGGDRLEIESQLRLSLEDMKTAYDGALVQA
ncbi:MAG TPA: phosphoribosylformylglycinamidine synthase subunit PurL [Candidatus Dormibacteraeota bacterium]|jgi:phosphoribosylformylglycinamidine synthase|nr:phosphoribosylformylglycinamidine synthase subunit PurL [Candidatus Dormibacteraeota bacterium]